MAINSDSIALIGVATDLPKVKFWEEQAKRKNWLYRLTGMDTRYEWSSHGTKIRYILDAISELPSQVEYVLISDTYDSFVNVPPVIVAEYFKQFSGTVHFGNDLKYYEKHKWIYPLFPNYFANKLHNYFKLDENAYYFQSGIVGGNRQAVVDFYTAALEYVSSSRREQKSITLMLNEKPEILQSLQLIGLDKFAHLFTRLYLFNFKKISYDQSQNQFIIDGKIPFVIHCPGALRPTITSYFWQYFISYGAQKNWRIRPFIK